MLKETLFGVHTQQCSGNHKQCRNQAWKGHIETLHYPLSYLSGPLKENLNSLLFRIALKCLLSLERILFHRPVSSLICSTPKHMSRRGKNTLPTVV